MSHRINELIASSANFIAISPTPSTPPPLSASPPTSNLKSQPQTFYPRLARQGSARKTFTGNKTEIDRGDLQSGVYL